MRKSIVALLVILGLMMAHAIAAEEEAKEAAGAETKEEEGEIPSDAEDGEEGASGEEGISDAEDDKEAGSDEEEAGFSDEDEEGMNFSDDDEEGFDDEEDDFSGDVGLADGEFGDEEQDEEPWVDDPNSKVVNVNGTEAFESATKSGVVMAEFYAPWCGYCKQLRPHYDAAAAALEGKVTFIKVDATQNEELANKLNVEGYPTLMVYNEGKKQEYDGPMNKEGMVFYLNRLNEPDVTDIDSVDAFNAFKEANKFVVVSTHSAESEEGKAFADAAKELRSRYALARVVDAGVQSALKLNAGKVAVRSAEDAEQVSEYEGEKLDAENLGKFISVASTPLVIDFEADNGDGLANLDENTPLLFAFVPKDDETMAALTKAVAKQFKGKLYVATASSSNSELQEQLDMKDSGAQFALIPTSGRFLFPTKQGGETVSEATVKAWLEDFFAGKLKPTVKSEPVPTEQTSDSYKLVADSFEEEARKSPKDVLVFFHLPWCGYCKKMRPTYMKLAEAFKGVENIRIADMDGDANDVDPELGIEGFPTVILFKKDGTHVTFEGKRSLISLAKFVKDNAGNEFEMPAEIQKVIDEKAAKAAKGDAKVGESLKAEQANVA